MSKRFTDSEKFRDNWYRKLTPKHKCLWEFMLSECSLAGILEIDFDSMSFHIGEKITSKDLELFEDRIIFISKDKIFIPKFIQFQQGELNENNPAHKNIIKLLTSLGIDKNFNLQDIKSTFKAPMEELQSSISNSIGKGNSNGISKSIEKIENKTFGEMKKVKLSDEEYEKLKVIYGDNIEKAINILDTYLAAKGDKYKSHYAVMKRESWVHREFLKNNPDVSIVSDEEYLKNFHF